MFTSPQWVRHDLRDGICVRCGLRAPVQTGLLCTMGTMRFVGDRPNATECRSQGVAEATR